MINDIPNDFTGVYVWGNSGATCHCEIGLRHREDGPAVA